jgi:signal transduction histidine kinase
MLVPRMASLSASLAPVDVVAVAQRIVSAMADFAWQRGKVLVTLDSSCDEIWIVADGERLEQALVNLLHYAVCRSPPGGLVIVRLEDQADVVVLQVQLTGEDLSSADLAQIWDRQESGHTPAGGKPSVARVKELVEEMGGSVAVENTPGEGWCFRLALPRNL